MEGALWDALKGINREMHGILDDLIAAKKRKEKFFELSKEGRPGADSLLDNAEREITETSEDLLALNMKRDRYLKKIREKCPHSTQLMCEYTKRAAMGEILLHCYLCTRCGLEEDDWVGHPKFLAPSRATEVSGQGFYEARKKVQSELYEE